MTSNLSYEITLKISEYLDFPMILNLKTPSKIYLNFDKALKPQRYLEILKYIQQYLKDNVKTELFLQDPLGHLNNALNK